MADHDRREDWSSPGVRVRATCLRCGAHLTATLVHGEAIGECSTCGSTLVEVLPEAPLIDRSPPVRRAAFGSHTRLRGSASVVIVDDHPLVCQAVQRTMEGAGNEIVGVATDGRLGLEMIRERRPDVAIIDMDLPSLSGSEVIARVRREAIPTQIVVYTATAEDDLTLDAKVGADAIVFKTAEAGELVRAVAALRHTNR